MPIHRLKEMFLLNNWSTYNEVCKQMINLRHLFCSKMTTTFFISSFIHISLYFIYYIGVVFIYIVFLCKSTKNRLIRVFYQKQNFIILVFQVCKVKFICLIELICIQTPLYFRYLLIWFIVYIILVCVCFRKRVVL